MERPIMAGFFLTAPPVVLIFLTAIGYAIATIGMKILSTSITPMGYVLLFSGILIFIFAEISLLRQSHLALAYIAIIAAETLLVVGYSTVIGEMLSLRQALGAGLVFVGFVTLTAAA